MITLQVFFFFFLLYSPIRSIKTLAQTSGTWKEDLSVGILSRHKLHNFKQQKYPLWKFRLQRDYVTACVTINDRTISITGTHLQNDIFGIEQKAQLQFLAKNLQNDNRGRSISFSVVCGDFNMPGGQFKSFKKQLNAIALWQKFGDPTNKWGATFPAQFPLVRLDHIFATRQIIRHFNSINLHVPKTQASDHRPVVCILAS
eukprot:TRINITY_DN8085_c0_g1_i1.p1 TRINITY_DN8085_c0_g1~~TRINITY_DN8085_c0_g1_i1.p1  ORF type:complete len:201 (+),score=23.91 TRINITY_DN8085_c0_g1_i1:284-886(+)